MTADDAGARQTYDAFASSYDDFNHAYMNERWTARLLDRAETAGLVGERLLDVGCGTGHSFMPMLDRGWRVTGCDISPAMLDLASAKSRGNARLELADMRRLPRYGDHDLIWAVNDAINYLMSVDELVDTLAGMRENLAAGGMILFDVNTLATYRAFFGADHEVQRGGRRFLWSGQARPDEVVPGAIYEALFDGDGGEVKAHAHRQRHFPEAEVLRAIDSAGLTCLEVTGERDGELHPDLDEDFHTKAVFLCGASRPASGVTPPMA
jgi:SAM-dependent methyltransferase